MRFYVNDWSRKVGDGYEARAESVNPIRGDAPRCPVCNRYVGILEWLPPYRINIRVFSEQLGDVVYKSGDIIVSDHFRQSFQEASLTGLEFRPVEVLKMTPKKFITPKSYYYAPVTRGRAAIDVAKSEFDRGPILCPECRTMTDVERAARVVLEEGSWDGLDIFQPRGWPSTLVSERFKEMCERKNITGFMLKPASEYAFDHMPWRKDWPKT